MKPKFLDRRKPEATRGEGRIAARYFDRQRLPDDVDGSTEPVALGSSLSGATAVIDGQKYTTPATVQLARNTNHTIIFKKDGFEDASASVASAANPWLFGDFLLWGPLAFLDFANGSA